MFVDHGLAIEVLVYNHDPPRRDLGGMMICFYVAPYDRSSSLDPAVVSFLSFGTIRFVSAQAVAVLALYPFILSTGPLRGLSSLHLLLPLI